MNILSIYKPNKKVTGHAMSLKISEDNALMLEIVKQSGYENGNGVFKQPKDKDGVKAVVKLSDFEASNIIYSIEKNKPLGLFHKTASSQKQIKFQPEGSERRVGSESVQERMVKFNISEGDHFYGMFLDASESQLIVEAMRYYLMFLFQTRRSAQYKK
tara:strand:- start:7974 stop:8447 length:474 start_codon:yes stop_codon:yes gene_type:complete